MAGRRRRAARARSSRSTPPSPPCLPLRRITLVGPPPPCSDFGPRGRPCPPAAAGVARGVH